MKTINPTTEEVIQEYNEMKEEEVYQVIREMGQAQNEWQNRSYAERADQLRVIARVLKQRKAALAEQMTREMGKPVKQAKSEIEKCAWVSEYYADHGEEFLADIQVDSSASNSYVTYNPLGLVLAIMPWNFPYWQLFRFGIPALMAGNGVLLKHAPNVTGCALEIEKIMHEAGIPEKLFRTLVIDVELTQKVIEQPEVRAVSLTGSTRAGKAVASKAGSHLKKTVLELGGSDPYLILEDADLDQAIEACATSRLINSGQSCIAAKRFIVVESQYEAFVEGMQRKLESYKVGDPTAEDTDVGSQAREDLRDELHRQVQESVDRGANCLMGGYIPDRKGFFYPVTLLTDVNQGMPAYEEELFGPVATVIKAKNEQEAIRIANDSDYGLGAAVFTEDEERGERIASGKTGSRLLLCK